MLSIEGPKDNGQHEQLPAEPEPTSSLIEPVGIWLTRPDCTHYTAIWGHKEMPQQLDSLEQTCDVQIHHMGALYWIKIPRISIVLAKEKLLEPPDGYEMN